MTHTIFIRSYRGDIPWLQHCLRSIQKFVTGFDEVCVVVPIDQKPEFNFLGDFKTCGLYSDDYMGQQLTKLNADQYTNCDLISFVDSDCCFNQPFMPNELYKDGKPVVMMTPYATMSTADAPWQKPTQEALLRPVEFEYMRRLPITFYREHIKDFRQWFEATHQKPIYEHVMPIQGRYFSEFNCLGAWCHWQRPNDYYWMDTTKEPLPKTFVEQHWSWGGMTPEIVGKLEVLLK